MFKVGDEVKIVGYVDAFLNEKDDGRIGNTVTTEQVGVDDVFPYKCSDEINRRDDEIELINNNKTMENVKEKFVALFIKEPEKTFRKAGITNGDSFLTEEGQSVFLGYLLNKYGVDFKAEVVDEIVKEEKGDK